jgi:hypothetical protein
MTVARQYTALAVAISALALLTGCDAGDPSSTPTESASPSPSPTPSEEPGRPDASDLALSADGLGTLVFGEAPDEDPGTAMLVFDPTICTDEVTGYDLGIEEGDAGAGLWLPVDEYRDPGSSYGAWGVALDDGALARIDLYDATVPTDGGIRIGDPLADVLSAHPDAVRVEMDLTDIYVVTGEHGTIQIEVAHAPDGYEYWEADQIDTVVYIHAARSGVPPFTVVASENIVGICSIA